MLSSMLSKIENGDTSNNIQGYTQTSRFDKNPRGSTRSRSVESCFKRAGHTFRTSPYQLKKTNTVNMSSSQGLRRTSTSRGSPAPPKYQRYSRNTRTLYPYYQYQQRAKNTTNRNSPRYSPRAAALPQGEARPPYTVMTPAYTPAGAAIKTGIKPVQPFTWPQSSSVPVASTSAYGYSYVSLVYQKGLQSNAPLPLNGSSRVRSNVRHNMVSSPAKTSSYTPSSPALPLLLEEEHSFHRPNRKHSTTGFTRNWQQPNLHEPTNRVTPPFDGHSQSRQRLLGCGTTTKNRSNILDKSRTTRQNSVVLVAATIDRTSIVSRDENCKKDATHFLADDYSGAATNTSKAAMSHHLANNDDDRLEYNPCQPQYSPSYDPDPFYNDSEYDPAFPYWND